MQRRETVQNSQAPAEPATRGATIAFRWSYIMLPLIILLLSVILVVFFYSRLPAEVAYRFQSDGSPDKWLGRGLIILWLLLPQLIFTLLAVALTWGISRLSVLFRPPENALIKPEQVLWLMGNMIALPQIVLAFAMLDIFSYNSYQVHLLPLWVFALIVMLLGGIGLGIFFIRAMRQVWSAHR